MTIQEGWIWTYYNCSHACYLFGKFELPCIFMTMSYAITGLLLIGLILFFMKKFAFSESSEVEK